MKKIEYKNLDMYSTITCGQIFRYDINNDEYTIYLDDRIAKIKLDDKYMYITSNNEDNIEDKIKNYLDLNRDYNKINNILITNDNKLKDIIDCCNGFKVINSPKFEMIISYMISANNNVRNITNSVNLLSNKYGKKIIFDGKEYYLFPTLEDMKKLTIEDLNNCKLGFRSKFIYDLIQNIELEDIENISNLNTNDALNYLMNYKGIGLKIASCILLFGYNRLDVFPIDTWVKKYMNDVYGISDINKIKEFTELNYKEYSGLVIQYMFHAKRNK